MKNPGISSDARPPKPNRSMTEVIGLLRGEWYTCVGSGAVGFGYYSTPVFIN